MSEDMETLHYRLLAMKHMGNSKRLYQVALDNGIVDDGLFDKIYENVDEMFDWIDERYHNLELECFDFIIDEIYEGDFVFRKSVSSGEYNIYPTINQLKLKMKNKHRSVFTTGKCEEAIAIYKMIKCAFKKNPELYELFEMKYGV